MKREDLPLVTPAQFRLRFARMAAQSAAQSASRASARAAWSAAWAVECSAKRSAEGAAEMAAEVAAAWAMEKRKAAWEQEIAMLRTLIDEWEQGYEAKDGTMVLLLSS